jgi:hypothetical protein
VPNTKEPPLWAPMFALPNVRTTSPIEVDGFALVAPDDFRITAINKQQPRLGKFLKKFKTEFGEPVSPSTIIWRRDKPDRYRTISAISGFRDLIALSVIPLAWTRAHRWHRNSSATYSDVFAVYPWMVDNRGEGLITSTPTLLGYHRVEVLKAQTTPALSTVELREADVDLLLLAELLTRWERCFSKDTPAVDDERLFRSLNMANSAAKLPAGADTNIYDTMRSVALWASAFEILRLSKREAHKKIYADLDRIEWGLSDCKDNRYAVFGEPPDKLRNLPIWLFGEINRLRNDTLHGNPLPEDRLIVAPAKRAINMYAAPLYRMMLAAHLDLKPAPLRPGTGLASNERFRISNFQSRQYQRDIEAALATIMRTEEEEQRLRQGRVRTSRQLSHEIAKAVEEAESKRAADDES